jgi:septation ring formation regulator EzrA
MKLEKVQGLLADAVFTIGQIEEQKANIIDTVRYIRQHSNEVAKGGKETEKVRENFEFMSKWFVKVGNQLGDVSTYINKEICDVEEAKVLESDSPKEESETPELTKLD